MCTYVWLTDDWEAHATFWPVESHDKALNFVHEADIWLDEMIFQSLNFHIGLISIPSVDTLCDTYLSGPNVDNVAKVVRS